MRIYSGMEAFFQRDGWKFTKVDDRPVIRLPFQGKTASWICYAQAREEDERFLFYAVCPLRAPKETYPAMCEFLTRANYGMIIGNFEMDVSDGEIRYKASLGLKNVEISDPLINNAVYPVLSMMDKYLPGIMMVLTGKSAEEAIQHVEGPDKTPAPTAPPAQA